ncbi:hypothetical protein VNO78_34390 [Psophocarpus tetragonolobus]|uniref:Protein kinase domain-containing protein n=1 Tax=Psophocarpus tetragonolobus TaxID=3891 RepID=A0AAN9RNU5_PSOTE
MGLCLSATAPQSSSLNLPHRSGKSSTFSHTLNSRHDQTCSARTDTNDNVGFSATTSTIGKSQFQEIASGSIDGEGSLPLPLPLPNSQILKWPNMKVFSFKKLKSATRNFSFETLLGKGGFGSVYKAWWNDMTLSPVKPGSENSKLEQVSWSTWLKIAIGAARGLAFLHDSETQVIFRDFKSSNILLDGNYNAKISDFGLALVSCGEESNVTMIMGTYGYIAPECMVTGLHGNS